uniref:Uncharacterized protein n=1 Tax=Arundo donax TaxID=35708 RepID=A0A0A9EF67_ARUDO
MVLKIDIPGLLASDCTVLCTYKMQNGPSGNSVRSLWNTYLFRH